MPHNFAAPSHRLLRETMNDARWRDRLWARLPMAVPAAPTATARRSPSRPAANGELYLFDRQARAFTLVPTPDRLVGAAVLSGDGRHVGSAIQAAHRAQMMFYAFSRMWPGGDRATDVTSGDTRDFTFTTPTGRESAYTVVTPPGYYDPQSFPMQMVVRTRDMSILYLSVGQDNGQLKTVIDHAFIESLQGDLKQMGLDLSTVRQGMYPSDSRPP